MEAHKGTKEAFLVLMVLISAAFFPESLYRFSVFNLVQTTANTSHAGSCKNDCMN